MAQIVPTLVDEIMHEGIGAMRMLLRPFWGQYNMLLKGQVTEFHMYEYLPFLPIASFINWFQLSDRSLISQATTFADEAC